MQNFGRGCAGLVLSLFAIGCSDDEGGSSSSAAALDKLTAALGGQTQIDALTGLEIEGSGTRRLPHEGQSPDDEAVLANTFQRTVSIDFEADALRIETTRDIEFLFQNNESYTHVVRENLGASTQLAFGAPLGALGSDKVASIRRQETLLTPHLLLRQIDRSALMSQSDVSLQGVAHHRLVSSNGPAPLTFYVNAQTGELSKLETMELDFYRRDVMLEVFFEDYEPAGDISFPRSMRVVRDGYTVLTQDVSEVSVNPTFDADTFEFPDGVMPSFDQDLFERGVLSHQWYYLLDSIGLPFQGIDDTVNATDVAPGVLQLTGNSHHSFLVEQAEGLVLVDAPLYDDRGRALAEFIADRFPSKPITHVVASHFHEDHVAGIREVLGATQAALVVHESSEAFWSEVLEAPSTLRPDALARAQRDVTILTVADGGSLELEDATRPVMIHHLETGHAADMLLTHEPLSNSVFVVDIYSPGNDQQFGAAELAAALEAYDVPSAELKIVGGHGNAIDDYETLQGFLMP